MAAATFHNWGHRLATFPVRAHDRYRRLHHAPIRRRSLRNPRGTGALQPAFTFSEGPAQAAAYLAAEPLLSHTACLGRLASSMCRHGLIQTVRRLKKIGMEITLRTGRFQDLSSTGTSLPGTGQLDDEEGDGVGEGGAVRQTVRRPVRRHLNEQGVFEDPRPIRSNVRATRPLRLPEISYLDLLRLDHPSDFIMFRALQLTKPSRHQITREEASEDRPLVLTFLVYGAEMPHTTEFVVEKSVEYPPRWRLSRPNRPPTQRRDISEWKPTGEHFFAYSNALPGTTALHVDWQTSPDRYVISAQERTEPLLTRCLTFYAYLIRQVFVLRSEDGDMCRMVEANMPPEPDEGWHVTHAFRVLDRYILGTNHYFVQHLDDPFPRVRVAMTAANAVGWVDDFSFYAFDVAVKGTIRYSVYQRSSVPITRARDPEQYLLATGMVVGPWQWRFDFFAFPINLDGGKHQPPGST